MKGYIQGKTIILLEELPENIKEGDEVEISIQNISLKKSRSPIFKLGVKDEYLNQEKIEKTEDKLLLELK